MLEKDIQRQFVDYMDILEAQCKCYYARMNSFKGQILRSNGTKGYISNNKPGISDFIVAGQNGVVYWVELKAPKKKQSPDQVEFEKTITKLGHQYLVIDSPEKIDNFVGLLKNLL